MHTIESAFRWAFGLAVAILIAGIIALGGLRLGKAMLREVDESVFSVPSIEH